MGEQLEYDPLEFVDDETWEKLKEEIATQHTPEDGENNGENC